MPDNIAVNKSARARRVCGTHRSNDRNDYWCEHPLGHEGNCGLAKPTRESHTWPNPYVGLASSHEAELLKAFGLR